MDDTTTKRRTPARTAASANRTAAPWSTVSLRADPAARAGARREDRRVRAPQAVRDLLDRGRLQVQQDRFGTGLPQVVALLRPCG